MPIGNPEIIRNVNHDRLKQFYTDWYRPDLMAVIVVGDFNKANMEFQIRSHFGSIPAATSPRPRPTYTVPAQTGTAFSVITDPEATNTRISATSTMTAREQMTIGSYRQHMVEQLFSAMLSTRLAEISQAPNAPFLRAQTDRDLFVRTIEVTSLDALVAQGQRRTRTLGALHRACPRRALWVHGAGAGSDEAQPPARAGARRR